MHNPLFGASDTVDDEINPDKKPQDYSTATIAALVKVMRYTMACTEHCIIRHGEGLSRWGGTCALTLTLTLIEGLSRWGGTCGEMVAVRGDNGQCQTQI